MLRRAPRDIHTHTAITERGATVVEYVGLGALSTLLVSGVASALGSDMGQRLGESIVRRLVEVISTGG